MKKLKNLSLIWNCLIIMTSEVKVGTCKNLFCRDRCWRLYNNYYGKDVFANIPGARLRNCSYGDTCRGAHTEQEIHTLPHVHNFNVMDKSKINLVEIYFDLIKTFEECKSKVLNKSFQGRLETYKELDFISLMNLWFDITCYHRKIKKEMKADENFKSEFSNIKQIPEFLLECEDIIWSLERLTKMCPNNIELTRKINSKTEKPVIWDICLASINCKLGCHNESYMICNQDLLTGSCDCLSKEDFESSKERIVNEIAGLNEQLNPESTSGFQTIKLNKKKRQGIQRRISTLQYELKNLKRKVHLTDEGLIPFEKQLANHLQKEKDAKEKAQMSVQNRSDKMKTIVKKKVMKPKLK